MVEYKNNDLDDIYNENHKYDIPQSVIDNEIKQIITNLGDDFDIYQDFDPDIHLNYKGCGKKYTFDELGIQKTHVTPINDIAATEPFELFSEEAVKIMKYEIFGNEELLKKYGRLNNLGQKSSQIDLLISGFIDDTRFLKQAWNHPTVKQLFNDIMEDQLIIPHRFCMSHVNVSLASMEGQQEVQSHDREYYVKLKQEQDKNIDTITSTVNWHYDSPPLVCVLMLSAPEDMVGGETGIRLGDESIHRIAGPKPGSGTMLQGRVIKHIATKPLNNFERISYVVSFVPEDPMRYDSTCATSERPGAATTFTNDKFYPTFLDFRFDRMTKQLDLYRQKLQQNYTRGEKFNQHEAVTFMKGLENYLATSYQDFETVNNEAYPPPLFSIPYKELPGDKRAAPPT